MKQEVNLFNLIAEWVNLTLGCTFLYTIIEMSSELLAVYSICVAWYDIDMMRHHHEVKNTITEQNNQ